ncbi:nucleoside hydrolase [Kaistia dalseonensis]|uniref:Inosine-uridine nucleoside N-ribohydrolase n=1 Tax=Kaistia dalseonensis TaxID=410840 RepID=A0ABU0H5V2_9HYPH|nr:nucleoside hydrolase [Kaistia dalseonensis]MCX5495108.1 nucleoside hydrolase [Kaistia dalseonensis]MDQ0437690.1 inosine-uridine nucleoside N-ribohydrolase [Kaistia dalseonensis]
MALHKVIYDTDIGVDDAMALLMLEFAPEVDLVGITTVFGNIPVETATRNALYVKDLFNIAAPVAAGAGTPLVLESKPAPVHVHGENGLGDIPLPDVIHATPHELPAHRFIIDMVRKHPNEITIVAVGRMTNLALALREDPGIAALVKEVVIMGGAFGYHGHSGNVTPVAEANIIGDPHAADEMFAAAWPVVVLGLDVTQECVMTTAYMAEIRDKGGKGGQFLWDVTRFYEDFYRKAAGIDGVFGHDSSAVAYVLDPTLYAVRSGPIRVVTEGIAIGQTIQMPNTRRFPAAASAWAGRPEHTVCIEVDAQRFLDLYFNVIVDGAKTRGE